MRPLVAPVEPLIVTSRYGPRPRPAGPLHPGIDLRAQLGQAVRAVAAGVVVDSRLSANDPPDWRPSSSPPPDWPEGVRYPRVMGYGNLVSVAHDDGLLSRYAHLGRRLVDVGDRVEAGQVVGFAGSTGYSFGPHLHFELRPEGGRAVADPLPLLAHLNPVVL